MTHVIVSCLAILSLELLLIDWIFKKIKSRIPRVYVIGIFAYFTIPQIILKINSRYEFLQRIESTNKSNAVQQPSVITFFEAIEAIMNGLSNFIYAYTVFVTIYGSVLFITFLMGLFFFKTKKWGLDFFLSALLMIAIGLPLYFLSLLFY